MYKLYNTQGDISIGLFNFFNSLSTFRKTRLVNLVRILVSLVYGESSVIHDIAKNIKDNSNANIDSTIKRIRRFLSNKSFSINYFYDIFIRYIISHYNIKHSDNRIHISFDHVFILKKYVALVFSLRVGKTSIPLWFRTFKFQKGYQQFINIKDGIDYCLSLFKDSNVSLIYLGDRGFFSTKTFKYFDSLGISFYIRVKGDTKVRTIHGENKGHTIYLKDINKNINCSKFLYNVYLSKHNYRCNIAISKCPKGMDEPWFIATNSDPKRAIKDYGYRFGSIETSFKNMKTNGFYLEKTGIRNLYTFNTMFGIICIALTWMVIIGCDITKNKKNNLIGAVKKIKGKYVRILSLFNAGLTWFHKCLYSYNSLFKLKYNFILYDV